MTFLHGDMRFYNNIFVQQPVHPALEELARRAKDQPNAWDDSNVAVGTFPYNGYPTFQEWDKLFEGYCGMGSPTTDRYYTHLPVWSAGNVYFGGAPALGEGRVPLVAGGARLPGAEGRGREVHLEDRPVPPSAYGRTAICFHRAAGRGLRARRKI